MPEWRLIETAPKTDDPIEVWHKIWNCPVAVQWRPDFMPGTPWLEKTKGNTWPEDAFTHWRPASFPPVQEQPE